MPSILKRLYPIILLVVATGCRTGIGDDRGSQKETEYSIVIKGLVQNGAGETIYLDEIGAREFIPVDTASCNEQGEFNIRFHRSNTNFYALRSTSKGYITLLLKPDEEVIFKGNYHSVHPYEVKGSDGSELIRELSVEHKKVVDAMARISRDNRAALSDPEYRTIKQKLDRKFDSLASYFYDYSLRFIHNNPQSPAILIALYNQYGYGLPVFSLQSDLDVYCFVDSALSIHFPDNESVKMLHSQIESARQTKKAGQKEQGLKTGDTAPDFILNDPDGNKVVLRNFRGKYVLLSFWATWSKPSMQENTYLKKAYRMFSDKDLVIFQVSIDENASYWKHIIESDTLSWYHASDLKRWDSRVNDLYYLEKIPANFLINPNGTILATDLFGQELIEELSRLLSK